MITKKQIRNIINLPQEDQDIILQEIVNEGLGMVSVKEAQKILGVKEKKTIYNRLASGKLKGRKISGLQFVYLNWKL